MNNFRRQLTHDDLSRMRVPERYWDVTFDQVSDVGDLPPRRIVQKYVEKIDEMMSRGAGLLLHGPNGAGKTSAAVVIGKEFRRRGETVMFMACSEIKSAIISGESFDSDQTLWDRARSVSVLLLDDLGKGVQDSKGFGARALDDLLRYRNSRRRVTFISTNMSPGPQLETELKKSTLHSLKESIIPVHFVGPDLRDDAKRELLGLLTMEG